MALRSSRTQVIERRFARLGRCRRLAKDREKSVASAEAWIDLAHIRLTTRRLARFWGPRRTSESGFKKDPCESLASGMAETSHVKFWI